jgi:hypothetical protein
MSDVLLVTSYKASMHSECDLSRLDICIYISLVSLLHKGRRSRGIVTVMHMSVHISTVNMYGKDKGEVPLLN